MIVGLGIDIIQIDRIERSIQQYKSRFTSRIFTDKEKAYCESKANKYQHYAVRFAGKEALLKAIGKGLRDGISWKDIEFINDELGKPYTKCFNKLDQLLKKRNVRNIFVTFSHSENSAVAVVILESTGDLSDI